MTGWLSGALYVILIVGVFFCGAVWGGNAGMQLAVDKSLREGGFAAHGRKWRAVEIVGAPEGPEQGAKTSDETATERPRPVR